MYLFILRQKRTGMGGKRQRVVKAGAIVLIGAF